MPVIAILFEAVTLMATYGGVAQLGERLLCKQDVVGSSPSTSTIRNKRPYGEYVEGLSYCRAKSYVDKRAVQPVDFEDLAFFGIIRRSHFWRIVCDSRTR